MRKFPVEQFTSDRVGLVLAFWALGIHLGRPLVCRPSYSSSAIEQNLTRAVFQQRAQNDISLCALGITSAGRRCALEKQLIEIIFRYLADIVEMSNVQFGRSPADRMIWCWYFSAASGMVCRCTRMWWPCLTVQIYGLEPLIAAECFVSSFLLAGVADGLQGGRHRLRIRTQPRHRRPLGHRCMHRFDCCTWDVRVAAEGACAAAFPWFRREQPVWLKQQANR